MTEQLPLFGGGTPRPPGPPPLPPGSEARRLDRPVIYKCPRCSQPRKPHVWRELVLEERHYRYRFDRFGNKLRDFSSRFWHPKEQRFGHTVPGSSCARCGRPGIAHPVVGRFNKNVPCNARCTSATGHDCECSCAGKNHGADHGALANPPPASWRDALVDADRVVHPRGYVTQDDVERALAAGAIPPLRYLGTGATASVFEDARGLGFKVSRTGLYYQTLEAEAAWLEVASQVPFVQDHVVRFVAWRPDLGVLVREAVHGKGGTWGQSKRLADLHEEIERVMLQYGFTSPEFKEESYVVVPGRGPVLFDAGFVYRTGSRLARWTMERARKGANASELRDHAFAIRSETWQTGSRKRTIPIPVANKLLAKLRALGADESMTRPVKDELENPRREDPRQQRLPFEGRMRPGSRKDLFHQYIARLHARMRLRTMRAKATARPLGTVRGLEYEAVRSPHIHVVITPSVRGDAAPGAWQVTTFGHGAPWGHENAPTLDDAIEEATRAWGELRLVARANPPGDEGVRALAREALVSSDAGLIRAAMNAAVRGGVTGLYAQLADRLCDVCMADVRQAAREVQATYQARGLTVARGYPDEECADNVAAVTFDLASPDVTVGLRQNILTGVWWPIGWSSMWFAGGPADPPTRESAIEWLLSEPWDRRSAQ